MLWYYVKETRPWKCHYLRWRTGWRSAGGGEIRSKRGKQFCEETNKARNSWPHKERTAICELMLQKKKKKSYYHPSCREKKLSLSFLSCIFLSHLLISVLFSSASPSRRAVAAFNPRDLPGSEIDFKSETFSLIFCSGQWLYTAYLEECVNAFINKEANYSSID